MRRAPPLGCWAVADPHERIRDLRLYEDSALSGFSDGETLTTTSVTAAAKAITAAAKTMIPMIPEGGLQRGLEQPDAPRVRHRADAVGAGALPDAAEYARSRTRDRHTPGNVSRAAEGLDLPSLEALGLGNVEPLEVCLAAGRRAGDRRKAP